jgi:hypothetical protein
VASSRPEQPDAAIGYSRVDVQPDAALLIKVGQCLAIVSAQRRRGYASEAAARLIVLGTR